MIEPYYLKTENEQTLFKKDGFVKGWSIPQRGAEQQLPMEEVPPFLRTLLVTDGTVTKSLEAYFWEPVSVVPIDQGLRKAEYDVPWLKVASGEDVLTREVKLQGVNSHNVYATAFSIIRPKIIPAFFRQRLLRGEIGIGMLIRDSGMESYREVLEIGLERFPSFHYDQNSNRMEKIKVLFRTYRIVLGGEAAILITERFPKALFE